MLNLQIAAIQMDIQIDEVQIRIYEIYMSEASESKIPHYERQIAYRRQAIERKYMLISLLKQPNGRDLNYHDELVRINNATL